MFWTSPRGGEVRFGWFWDDFVTKCNKKTLPFWSAKFSHFVQCQSCHTLHQIDLGSGGRGGFSVLNGPSWGEVRFGWFWDDFVTKCNKKTLPFWSVKFSHVVERESCHKNCIRSTLNCIKVTFWLDHVQSWLAYELFVQSWLAYELFVQSWLAYELFVQSWLVSYCFLMCSRSGPLRSRPRDLFFCLVNLDLRLTSKCIRLTDIDLGLTSNCIELTYIDLRLTSNCIELTIDPRLTSNWPRIASNWLTLTSHLTSNCIELTYIDLKGGFIVWIGICMNIGRIRARGGLLISRQSVLLGIKFLLFSAVRLSILNDFLLKLDDFFLAIISSGGGVID